MQARQSFVQDTLWPEFGALQQTLQGYLNEVTQRVIAQAIHSDVRDADEQPTASAGAPRGALHSDRDRGGPA